MGVKVFFLTATDRVRLSLRVYGNFPGGCEHFCNARVPVGEKVVPIGDVIDYIDPKEYADDERWPTKCSKCGNEFNVGSSRQIFRERIYVTKAGVEMTLRDAPPGACWEAEDHSEDFYKKRGWVGPDGRTLFVRCPGGHDWCPDSRASNCTLPDDTVHRCWVRHGSPEEGTLHVDKNGNTCSAGAGSIQTGNWHGFLHNGELE